MKIRLSLKQDHLILPIFNHFDYVKSRQYYTTFTSLNSRGSSGQYFQEPTSPVKLLYRPSVHSFIIFKIHSQPASSQSWSPSLRLPLRQSPYLRPSFRQTALSTFSTSTERSWAPAALGLMAEGPLHYLIMGQPPSLFPLLALVVWASSVVNPVFRLHSSMVGLSDPQAPAP